MDDGGGDTVAIEQNLDSEAPKDGTAKDGTAVLKRDREQIGGIFANDENFAGLSSELPKPKRFRTDLQTEPDPGQAPPLRTSDPESEPDKLSSSFLARRAARRKRRQLLDVIASTLTREDAFTPSWTRKYADFRPSSLTRAIETNRQDLVTAFVVSDFAHNGMINPQNVLSSFRKVINETDKRGRSPMAVALMSNNPTMVALLLSVENRAEDETPQTPQADELTPPVPEDERYLLELDTELSYADFGKFFDVPLLHLPLKNVGINPDASDQAAIVFAILLRPKIRHQMGLMRDGVPYDSKLTTIINRAESLLVSLNKDGEPLSLSEKALDQVDIEVTDYFGATVLWRLASLGLDTLVALFLLAGASPSAVAMDGSPVIQAAVSSRHAGTVATFFPKLSIPMSDRSFVVNLLRECVKQAAWRVLFAVVREAPELTSDEFEHVAQYAESVGSGPEFLETFRRAIDEEPLEGVAEFEIALECAPCETGVFTDPACRLHLGCPEPNDLGRIQGLAESFSCPEASSRLDVLLNPDTGILKLKRFKTCLWNGEAPAACLADMLRVHDEGYICYLRNKCEEAVRLGLGDQSDESSAVIKLDDDTIISGGSWEAAKRAAGCVIEAVRAVCEGRVRNAFCIVRPPGHHVGTSGAAQPPSKGPMGASVMATDSSIGSLGFCLLNNVAIGAAYARYHYASSPYHIQKIAIIDFDVHHGNGTEQIVRNLGRHTKTIEFAADSKWGNYLKVTMDVPRWKIWRDETDYENIMFASIHGFDGDFYPATGAPCHEFSPLILNVPISADRTDEFRQGIADQIVPALLDFKPDLIMLSAGFDGHAFDGMGQGFSKASEADYVWLTRQMVVVANICCRGKIVSVLEGGYNTYLGMVSPFARSVAAHLDTLHRTSTRRVLFDDDIDQPLPLLSEGSERLGDEDIVDRAGEPGEELESGDEDMERPVEEEGHHPPSENGEEAPLADTY